MWIESELFQIKVPIFFLGIVGFSLRRDGRYASFFLIFCSIRAGIYALRLAYAGILMLLEGETPLFVMLDMPKPPPTVCISEYEILSKLWAAPLWPSFVRRTG